MSGGVNSLCIAAVAAIAGSGYVAWDAQDTRRELLRLQQELPPSPRGHDARTAAFGAFSGLVAEAALLVFAFILKKAWALQSPITVTGGKARNGNDFDVSATAELQLAENADQTCRSDVRASSPLVALDTKEIHIQDPPAGDITAKDNAKEFFANIAIRRYDQIFKSEHIRRVLSHGSTVAIHPTRYLRAVGLIVGAMLNILNIASQFRHSLPAQEVLLRRLRAGSVLRDYSICYGGNSSATDFYDTRPSCSASENDVHNILLAILVWCELTMIIATIAFSIRGLLKLFAARVDIISEKNFQGWLAVAHGFGWMELLPSASAVKVLPSVKEIPSKLIHDYKLMKQQLTEDDGVYSTSDKLYLLAHLVFLLLRILMVALGGLFALHLKLESLAFLAEVPIGRWTKARWLPFLGFVNQISGLVPFGQLRKQAILKFVFTGEDAEMSSKEFAAMEEFNAMFHKRIFDFFGYRQGIVVALGVSDADLQKILITEDATCS